MITFIKKFIKIISINILLILLIILSAELLFGYWFDKDNFGPYMREHRMKNQRIIYKNATEEVTYFYRRNYFGFRGADIDPSKIQAVIFGGSVIDERYKPDKYTITGFLNKKLKENNFNVNFINGGIEGQSSAGMVSNFNVWLNKLKNFSPKYIIYYVGINDSLISENIVLSNEHDGHLLRNEKKAVFLDNIRSRSILLDSLRKIKFKFLPKKGFVKYNGKITKDYIDNFKFTTYVDAEKKYDVNFLQIKHKKRIKNYLMRIDKLQEYSNKINSKAIFVTNIGSKGYDETLFIQNYSIMKHCKKKNYHCMDLAKELNPKIEYWVDDVHTSKSGSEAIAEKIYNNIKNIIIN